MENRPQPDTLAFIHFFKEKETIKTSTLNILCLQIPVLYLVSKYSIELHEPSDSYSSKELFLDKVIL